MIGSCCFADTILRTSDQLVIDVIARLTLLDDPQVVCANKLGWENLAQNGPEVPGHLP